MTIQENVKNSQSATSIFFKYNRNGKSISKPTDWQREEPQNQVLVVSTRTSSALSQETLQPTNDFRCKEKVASKRYKSHESKIRIA